MLEDLYKQMAELTKPKCLSCKSGWKHKCCDPMYCAMAKEYAKECNIELEYTGNTIPFLDDNYNCIVPPHLRPLCTLHTCDINSKGVTSDPDWDAEYFRLREMIDNEELKRYVINL